MYEGVTNIFHKILIQRQALSLPSFLCSRHSKNGGEALSVTPVRACVRAFVRPCVRACVRLLSKFGVRSITFERLHEFN